jgi:hypothetical protein
MKTQITIKVSTDVARVLRTQEKPTIESKKLCTIAEKLNVVLEPLHSETEEPLLASYFVVDVPDSATAEIIISNLRQSAAIEAAYLKPPDEAP